MRRTLLLLALSISFGVLLVGCQNSPGGVFSPKSDIHIKLIFPFRIALDIGDYLVDDGKAVFTPEITNGIAAMVKGARVNYYSQSGRLFDQRLIVTQVWIRGTDLTSEQTTTTTSIRAQESTTTTTGDTTGGVITMQIGDYVIYKEMMAREEYSLMAKIVIFGTDENGNDFEITTQMPVALEDKAGEGEGVIGTSTGTSQL